MATLAGLPPPPTGQKGITPGSLSLLPPPPTGAKGLTLAQLNPPQTLMQKAWSSVTKDPVNAAANVLGTLFPAKATGENVNNAFTAIKQFAAGDSKGLQATSNESNKVATKALGETAQNTANIASLMLPSATAATKLGRIGQTAATAGALGGISGAGESIAQGDNLKDTAWHALASAGVGAALGGGAQTAVEGIRSFGSILSGAGDKISNSVIKPSIADVKDGFDIATVKKHDLGGSLHQTLTKTNTVMNDLSQQLKAKLEGSDLTADINGVYERTVRRTLGNNFQGFGANGNMDKALEQLRGEIARVVDDKGTLALSDAQTVKQAAGTFGAWLYGNPDPDSTARQKVYNVFYNELKKEIENKSPEGVKAINQELSKLIPVRNAVLRRIPVAERNSALGLNDMISLAVSTLQPHALGLTLANFVAKSGKAGRLLSKTGGAIENAAGSTVVQGAANAVNRSAPNIAAQLTSQPPNEQPEQTQSEPSPVQTQANSTILGDTLKGIPNELMNPSEGSLLKKVQDFNDSLGGKPSAQDMAMNFGAAGTAKAVGKAVGTPIQQAAERFVAAHPPYGLLKDMERYIILKRDGIVPKGEMNAAAFEANLRDALTNFGANVEGMNEKSLISHFEAILNVAEHYKYKHD